MVQFAALLLRAVIAIFAGLLIAGGTLTLAADRAQPQRPQLVAATTAGPQTLVVPAVTGQAYVFAKGILEDGGFAWRVTGGVKGYAGNTVADQFPSAGTVVVDTGAPTVTLTLVKNKSYAELGAPENAAPYAGTVVRIPASGLAARPILTPTATRPAAAHKPRTSTAKRKPGAAKARVPASRAS
jgi:hypothetical protein